MAGSINKEIAIIGAGIIGTSTALHLLRAGAHNVTLIDAVEPGMATTGAGAGFVSHWSAGMLPEVGHAGFQMQDYGLDFYRGLKGIGYRNNGTLMMALSEAGRTQHLLPVLDSDFAPPEMRDLTRDEIGVLMQGLVNPSLVHSAAFNPHGIQIETGLANARMLTEVQRLGGKVIRNSFVSSMTSHNSTTTVHHKLGEIQADVVVIAAGAWTNDLLRSLGYHLPMLRVVATRIVTGDCGLPAVLPTVQCREIPIWLREKSGGITWGTTAGYASLHDLGGEQLPGQPQNQDLFDQQMKQQSELEALFPPLKGTKVQRWHQGIPCYTPDNCFYLGPVPGQHNILVGAGDNETGVTHGPGMGRALAELALDQEPFVDTMGFALDRPGLQKNVSEAEIVATRAARRLPS